MIAPTVGGTQTGGQNPSNWTAYVIPINLLYNVKQPVALGTGIVGAPAAINTGGTTIGTGGGPVAANEPNSPFFGAPTVGSFVTTPFCPNGGPNLPLTTGNGGTTRTCTNYFPTEARMGLDNDNIILTAPVLDEEDATSEGTLPISSSGRTSARTPVPVWLRLPRILFTTEGL